MAPSSMFAFCLMTSPCCPWKRPLWINGRVASFSIPVFSAPIPYRSTTLDSDVVVNTLGIVLVLPISPFCCMVSPRVVDLVLSSTARSRFPALPAMWFRNHLLPPFVYSQQPVFASGYGCKWTSRTVHVGEGFYCPRMCCRRASPYGL